MTPRLVRLQLAGTGTSWQRRATAIKIALQVSETRPCPRKNWHRQYRHADHQSGSNTCSVPYYPCWITGDTILSPDKWASFSSININALTPRRAKSSLDPRNHIFIYLLSIHSILLLFSVTYALYSQPLLRHYWLWHLSSFGRYHTVATLPFSLVTTGFQTYFPSKVYETPPFIKTIYGFSFYTIARGAPVADRAKSYTNIYYVLSCSYTDPFYSFFLSFFLSFSL